MHAEISVLRVRKGSAKPLFAGHPWVFASALEGGGRRPEPGAEVRVEATDGRCLGRGFFSPRSAMAVRLLTREDRALDESFLEERLEAALRLRVGILGLNWLGSGAGRGSGEAGAPGAAGEPTTAFRLINSEGDGLGGLIVDAYAGYLAVQFGTLGMWQRRELLLDLLERRLGPLGILNKSDPRAGRLEGFEAGGEGGVLRGALPAGPVLVQELGVGLQVDLRRGQKTGLFLDQRENRALFAGFARGARVLDLFAYSGSFSAHAARAGARSLTLLDSSAPALEGARGNLEVQAGVQPELVCADWRTGLRAFRAEERVFDLVVVDPPKFAAREEQVERAIAGYRDLNAQAVRLVEGGGILFTCSCSGNVGWDDFERAVAMGLGDAGRRAGVLQRREGGSDHPVPPGFAQGRYLKCLVLRVE